VSDNVLDYEDGHDPFDLPDEIHSNIDLNLLASAGAQAYYEAIQNASNNTARSKQQQEHQLGISNLGHCRQYAKYMTEQIPFSDERDKTAAFFGTVAGDAIEAQLKIDHPGWLIQDKLLFTVEDYAIPGTCDVCIPASEGCTYDEFVASRQPGYVGVPRYMQGVWDGKSKAELETIKKYGPTQQQIFQIHAYAKAQIDKGNLDPTQPIIVMDVYFDRSGKDISPYGIAHLYNPDVVQFIKEWIDDVTYAVINHEDASRDMSRDWCWKYCEFASVCRGNDTDVEGLIENPEAVATIEAYDMWSKRETEAANAKKQLKKSMEQIEPGSTGTLVFRKTWINGGHVEYDRPGYFKMEVRPVPTPKPLTKKQIAALNLEPKELES
jgi:hypothetical protein